MNILVDSAFLCYGDSQDINYIEEIYVMQCLKTQWGQSYCSASSQCPLAQRNHQFDLEEGIVLRSHAHHVEVELITRSSLNLNIPGFF